MCHIRKSGRNVSHSSFGWLLSSYGPADERAARRTSRLLSLTRVTAFVDTLEDAGFKVIQIDQRGRYPATIMQLRIRHMINTETL